MKEKDVLLLESGELLGQVIRSNREGALVCQEVFYPAGLCLGKHAHQRAFFGLSIDGHYRDDAGGKTVECHPRNVMFHAAGEEHSISVGESILRCFVVELDPVEVERRYGVLLPASVMHADGGPFAFLLTGMYREFRHPDSVSGLAIQGLLLQLLVGASRADFDAGHDRPRWLQRVTELLHERFRSRLTLEEMAAEVGVPPARISAVFKRVHRRSLAEEQRRLRIESACRRLLNANASIAAIALESGFSDQPHFSRAFKVITGMTPAQYRAMLTQ